MERVLVLGRGGAGKSTFARRLGAITGLPVVELDTQFWQPGSNALPREQWSALQAELVAPQAWILDGDLGPHDVLEPRLKAADTVFVLDYSLVRCSWRSARRSRERRDYWIWLLAYRRRSLPVVMDAIATHAMHANVHVFRTSRVTKRFLAQLASSGSKARAHVEPGRMRPTRKRGRSE